MSANLIRCWGSTGIGSSEVLDVSNAVSGWSSAFFFVNIEIILWSITGLWSYPCSSFSGPSFWLSSILNSSNLDFSNTIYITDTSSNFFQLDIIDSKVSSKDPDILIS